MSRLGELLLSSPELTAVAADDAGRLMIDRFTAYVCEGGCADVATMVTRLERLKFETIVQGKTYAQVLADCWPKP